MPNSENAFRAKTRVFLEPKTLVMAGATALTTALTLSPWIPVAGSIGIGLIVWRNLRERWQEETVQAAQSRYEVRLPVFPAGLEPEYRVRIQSIVDAQGKLFKEIRDSNDLVRKMMDPTLPAIRDLGQKYYTLLLKLRELNTYLESADWPALQEELKSLRTRISATTDGVTVHGLQHTLAAKTEKLKVAGDLKLGAERIQAQLESIQAALEKSHGQVVKMKSAEARHVSIESEDVSHTVQSLSEDVDALTRSFERVSSGIY